MAEPEKPIHYAKGSALDELALKSKQMDLQSGWLGKAFGSDKNAPMNIAGTIGVVLTLAGVGSLFLKQSNEVVEVWKYIGPILTGILGFIFGRKQ